MTDFLNSVKADLLDRRLLPLVAVVGVLLVAAAGYLVFGGGSGGSAPVAAVPSGPTTPPAGLAISQTTPETASAEMTSGIKTQHHGHARNPFTPLPQPKATTATTGSSSPATKSAGSGSSSGSGSSAPKESESTSSKPEPKPAPKPKTVYHVALLFGTVAAGAAPLTAQLSPYENVKLSTPLPTSGPALAVYRGVTAGGKSATFTLVAEAILHGQGACLPSAAQCEALDLKPGQYEQLEYLPASGAVVTYELRVVSIAASKAMAAGVKSILRGESKAGKALLRGAGLVAVPGMRYSTAPGVLVFSAHRAKVSRAHASAHRRRGR